MMGASQSPGGRSPKPAAKAAPKTPVPAPPPVRKSAQPIKTKINFIPQQSWLSYNWIDKDPELDFVIGCIQQSGRSAEWIEAESEKFGHRVSRYTILNWCYGSVKRPQNASMNTVMAVLGWTREWKR